jgi:hypothetical protein
MSGLRSNSITLYLRPTENQQPYQLNNCAEWLVVLGYFNNFINARRYIAHLEYNYPWKFKAVMSNYYDAVDYKQNMTHKKNVNSYQTMSDKYYGDEPHMY